MNIVEGLSIFPNLLRRTSRLATPTWITCLAAQVFIKRCEPGWLDTGPVTATQRHFDEDSRCLAVGVSGNHLERKRQWRLALAGRPGDVSLSVVSEAGSYHDNVLEENPDGLQLKCCVESALSHDYNARRSVVVTYQGSTHW